MIRAYAVLCYLFFLGTLVYVVGWLADTAVPRGISDGPRTTAGSAVLLDLALLGVFAVQHSVMARPWFKRVAAAVVPRAAERATYVLLSSAAVALLAWQWRPLDSVVWSVGPPFWRAVLWAGYGLGWLVVVLSTVMIGHLDLFGLAQALRGDRYAEPRFGTPGFYAVVRHPIMTGFLVAFWATPDLTVGRLVFAGAATGYVVVAVRLEERDLRAHLGPDYVAYEAEVPRFVPAIRRRARAHGPERPGPTVGGGPPGRGCPAVSGWAGGSPRVSAPGRR